MADKRGRCSSPLIIRARHIAHAPPHRQPSFPPAPTPGTHRLPQSAWRGGTASKENEFLSPSSWPFHKNLFACRSRHRCACSFHTGCRSTACRGQQDVLAAGPNCPGATETWADGGGQSQGPQEGRPRSTGRQKARGTCPQGYARHTAGIFKGRHLWVGWVVCLSWTRSN